MMKVIIYQTPGNILSIVRPVWGAKRDNETEDKFLKRIRKKIVPSNATDIEIIDDALLPAKRLYRNAWMRDVDSVKVDMAKARTMKTDEIRAERNARLTTADQELSIAEDDNDQTAVARARDKRRALRDMPATVQAKLKTLKAVEDLKAFEPTWP